MHGAIQHTVNDADVVLTGDISDTCMIPQHNMLDALQTMGAGVDA